MLTDDMVRHWVVSHFRIHGAGRVGPRAATGRPARKTSVFNKADGEEQSGLERARRAASWSGVARQSAVATAEPLHMLWTALDRVETDWR